MDLAVIETVDNALCWVRQLGSDAPSPARLPPELVARAWEPASGDLVALDGGIIGYMWRRAIVVRERGDGGLVVRPTGRENPNGTIAWTIRALSSTLSAGDAVFLDARVGRWVAVDRAQAALPAHPSRLLHGYDPIKDEVRALAVWRRPAGPLHADMIEVTEEVVRRLLGRQFPSWADLPLARVASTGTVHAIYRLGDDMAVRLPLSPRFEGIRQEFEDLGKFGPLLPIPIPEPVALGEPDE
ncbi:MAG TPA: hypothetical protein VE990_10225, partial [Acidimicrobiales bacterium]|nr:hypothetical protein [Acidimicrobiales bacterium]